MKIEIPIPGAAYSLKSIIKKANEAIEQEEDKNFADYKHNRGSEREVNKEFASEIRGHIKKEILNDAFRGMEDRNNDWLAKQLREEQRILRSGVLSDLGAAHHVKCEAKEIKEMHHTFHMKGIDKL